MTGMRLSLTTQLRLNAKRIERIKGAISAVSSSTGLNAKRIESQVPMGDTPQSHARGLNAKRIERVRSVCIP